ncbi:MAG: hypothetical protein BM485_11455 [Desulfobulbaceae bacterium DB1]|nr:MAG: hypothetical protein BM485_11455 [Desulfobulbaceae bacterium DB1]
MKAGITQQSIVAVFLTLLMALIADCAHAKPITFNGTASYSKEEDESGTSSFNQNTTLNFDQTLTPVLGLDESVRYSTSYEEDRDTESIAPTVNLQLNNDIFYLDLSGTSQQMRNSESSNLDNKNWQSRWRSNWQKDYVPVIQFGYGQSQTIDDEDPARIDSKNNNSDMMVDWDLLVGKIYYTINKNISDDYAANSTNTATNQYLRLTSDKSLWQDRVNISFQGQYSSNKQNFSADLGSSGTVLGPRVTITDMRGVVDFDDAKMPEWEKDMASPLPQVTSLRRYNLAVKLDAPQQVNVLYLYTDKDLSADAALFRWDVYQSSDGKKWTAQTPSPLPIYNRTMQRFELEIPEQHARYIMLEERQIQLLEDFNITNVQAVPIITGTAGQKVESESETTHYTADTGISWKITEAWMTGYSLTLEDGETALGDDIDRTANSAYLSWVPVDFFSSRMSASESRSQEVADDPEEKGRSYAVSCASQLLPTLDMDLGVTRSENYEDDALIDSGYNYNAYFTALLFPDLTSTLDLVYFTSREEETDLFSQDYSQTLRFIARLTPGLTTELAGIYSTSRGETDSWSKGANLTVSWRASDILAMSVSGTQTWESDDSTPFLYNMTISLAPTYKTQLSLGYSHQEETDSYNANYTWILNDIFSLQFYANYVDRKESDSETGRVSRFFNDDRNDSRLAFGGQLNVRY